MGLFNKKENEKIAQLEKELEKAKSDLSQTQKELSVANMSLIKLKGKDLAHVEEMIKEKVDVCNTLDKDIETKKGAVAAISSQIEKLNATRNDRLKEIAEINGDIEMTEFGIYKPRYKCMDSGEYAQKIKMCRAKQKDLIKNKRALNFSDDWTLDGSLSEGKKMNDDNMKMYLRAYNNECDNQIAKVKYNNIDRIEERIIKIGQQINKLNVKNKLSIRYEYVKLKIEELHLCYEYEMKKQEEKEKLREERAQAREDAKLQAEIKAARNKINKDIAQFNNALKELIAKSDTLKPEEIPEWKAQVADLQEKIDQKNKEMEDVDYREANAKAGYVYVISNIGAFGKDVYKIGMTRRLEPLDRIDELSSASVPFKFDVHAMIFSDDAPHLESLLHNAFDDRKVNLMNPRKEFFKVPLKEIEKVVHDQFDPLVVFKEEPDADQYRESEKIRELNANGSQEG